ncbi:MAG TPA: TonB-dependent receptor [Candidatus Polarisedimenticolaceae bacterium]|nr:TonB-dependent receptor [Candidatus Polarisedimenticolaceae bacterium]
MSHSNVFCWIVLGTLAAASGIRAEDPAPPSSAGTEYVEVTATRIPEDPATLPVGMTIIDGQELRDRGVTDLAAALTFVSGVEIARGGDGGPASSVPELWGLKEFDAFLLVVDGVPWGGAFVPELSTMSLEDVARIEVLRGPAPVMYGATSFVGVIQVIHNDPGDGRREVSVGGGNWSSGGAGVSSNLPNWLGFQSRLSADVSRTGYRDPRTQFDRAHVLLRNQREAWGGHLRLDFDLAWLQQDPASPTPRVGAALTTDVPIDTNQNPDDAHVDPRRYTLNLGWGREFGAGQWDTLLSLSRTEERTLRGFLVDVSNTDPNAHGFRQDVDINALYLDTHLAHSGTRLETVYGLDYLRGDASARGGDFDYATALDDSAPPAAAPANASAARIDNRRGFLGLYAYTAYRPWTRWRFEAGLRLNRTSEERDTHVEELGGGTVEQATDDRDVTRLSGSAGATWTAWQREAAALRVYASYRNTFKPAVADLGIEAEPEILEPETSESWEAGAKATLPGGKIELQLAGFYMDLANLVVAQSVGGLPVLANAGSVRLHGADLEARGRVSEQLYWRAGYAYHDARFGDYVQDFGGTLTQLRGNRFEMSPRDLFSAGVIWARKQGLNVHGELEYAGARYLNKRNTALVGGYTTWGAGVGWRQKAWEVSLNGENLNDQRPAISESEVGDAQYYRLPARRVSLALRWLL